MTSVAEAVELIVRAVCRFLSNGVSEGKITQGRGIEVGGAKLPDMQC